MGSFVFENFSKETVTLQVEPWAQAFEIAPEQKVYFTFAEEDPPPNIDFAYWGPRHVGIGLLASEVTISGHGGPDMRFGFDETPET